MTISNLIDGLYDSMLSETHEAQGEPVDFCVDRETPSEPRARSLNESVVEAICIVSIGIAGRNIGRARVIAISNVLEDDFGVARNYARAVIDEAAEAGLVRIEETESDSYAPNYFVALTANGRTLAVENGWAPQDSTFQDINGNVFAEAGVDVCVDCGCKHYEYDRCVGCGKLAGFPATADAATADEAIDADDIHIAVVEAVHSSVSAGTDRAGSAAILGITNRLQFGLFDGVIDAADRAAEAIEDARSAGLVVFEENHNYSAPVFMSLTDSGRALVAIESAAAETVSERTAEEIRAEEIRAEMTREAAERGNPHDCEPGCCLYPMTEEEEAAAEAIEADEDYEANAEYRARLDAEYSAELDDRLAAKIAEQDAVNEAIEAADEDGDEDAAEPTRWRDIPVGTFAVTAGQRKLRFVVGQGTRTAVLKLVKGKWERGYHKADALCQPCVIGETTTLYAPNPGEYPEADSLGFAALLTDEQRLEWFDTIVADEDEVEEAAPEVVADEHDTDFGDAPGSFVYVDAAEPTTITEDYHRDLEARIDDLEDENKGLQLEVRKLGLLRLGRMADLEARVAELENVLMSFAAAMDRSKL